MEEYERAGYETVGVLSCDGSPTCGVDITSWGSIGGVPARLTFHTMMPLLRAQVFT